MSVSTASCRRSKKLTFETLEVKRPLAGDTYFINFQNDEATVPGGYLRDTGEVFATRSNGLEYGWSSDHTDQARERSNHPDQRFDTLIHFEAGQMWELALPNGTYEVTVAVGDPANNDGLHTVTAEGVSLFAAVPDTNEPMIATGEVTVADGRLTLDQGAAAHKATRIDFIHVIGLPSGPNTSPATPTIVQPSPAAGEINPIDVSMQISGFGDADGDAHQSTDWEIWSIGASGEPVWQSLGREGEQRLAVQLGDGLFINSLAGQPGLEPSSQYALRVRFRDSAGATSGYGVSGFTTAAEATQVPLRLGDVADAAAPEWVDVFGVAIDLSSSFGLLQEGDPIVAIDFDGAAQSDSPFGEGPEFAIDGDVNTKYLNFGKENSGLIITPANGAATVNGLRITTANDEPARDPTSWVLYGTSEPITSPNHSGGDNETWTLIGSGDIDPPLTRFATTPIIPVDNLAGAFSSYRILFPTVRDATSANSMQLAEVQLYASEANAFTPPTLRLEEGSSATPLVEIAGSGQGSNSVTNFPGIGSPAPVRVVIESGDIPLSLPQSNLMLDAGNGTPVEILLPVVSLEEGQRLDLWVAADGSTYFGTTAQSTPDFSLPAREAGSEVPFVATKAGFVIEEVGSNYRLPVNIAFVPDPGPNPDDPLYFVTELYGSVQVVTRDGTKHEFATGLLDYNPQGPISGSGEQGLTGIVVRRSPQQNDVYELYVTLLWDNGSPPGGPVHYPKVERLVSAPGGLAIDSRTVLLNMQPETQGQSHQISNISIGPDNKLYVHNGDGFNAGTAQNLDAYRGKVLRMNFDGSPPTDNPFYDASDGISARDYIFAYGLRNPFGGAWRASDGIHYQVENGPSTDRFSNVLPGVNYGWNGSNQSMTINAIYNWSPATAPVNITFVQPETFAGSQFPAEMQDHAFVSESGRTYATGPQSNGKRITEFVLDGNGDLLRGPDPLIEYQGEGQSTIAALAAGPDGLYFSTLYEDSGASGPTASGAKIYRVRYINPLVGDYDIDGDVDQDDYLVWKDSFGSDLLLAADGNGNGLVDSADYAIWRDNLGAGASRASANEAGVASVGAGRVVPSREQARDYAIDELFEPTRRRERITVPRRSAPRD